MSRSRPALALVVLTMAALLAGCATVPALPRIEAPDLRPSSPAHRITTQAPAVTRGAGSCDPRALSPAPAPGFPASAQPAGPALSRVLDQKYVRVGIGLDSPPFAFPGPDGGPQGFDVDIAREIARDLFGDPARAVLVPVPNDERESAVLKGRVDLVAETMTVTCDRASRVGFSSIYFEAEQRLLVLSVPAGGRPPIDGPEDLADRPVCVTEGSTSLLNVLALPGPPRAVVTREWNDCLTLLDQGIADAVSTDHAILDGLQSSNPFTRIVGPGFSPEPYGLALPPGADDLARAVNAALARVRGDGTWVRIYDRWLGYRGSTTPPLARYR